MPVRRVGRLVLDRTVDNFFAETEQVAFCTQNVVPGIDFTNDPLLQGRNFSYLDTQLKRLGSPNFAQLPVNAPKCPFAHFQQDGHMALAEPRRTGQLRAELMVGRGRGTPRGSRRRLPELPRAGRRRQAAGPIRTVRRPLQPGPSVLHQPDAGRAAAHHRRVRVRAQQVRAARDPGPDGGQPAQRRRGPRPRHRRRPPPRPAAGRIGTGSTAHHRPAGVARVEHRRQRPAALRRPQDRRPRHRRRRRCAPERSAQGSRRRGSAGRARRTADRWCRHQ